MHAQHGWMVAVVYFKHALCITDARAAETSMTVANLGVGLQGAKK
jgi:hypothetical protein